MNNYALTYHARAVMTGIKIRVNKIEVIKTTDFSQDRYDFVVSVTVTYTAGDQESVDIDGRAYFEKKIITSIKFDEIGTLEDISRK